MNEDITSRYQDEMNETFKIFRYNQEIYAVRYDETGPVDSIPMWISHKGENISKFQKIGHGEEGDVYGKTPHKAVKISKGKKTEEYATEANLQILKQQFLLKEKDIEQYFVLGLWNIKTHDKVHFYMSKIPKTNFNKNTDKPNIEEFVLALKELNESGYWHPDLANHHYHFSPQNLLKTADAIKAIDLDAGFAHGDYDDRQRVFGRDQWIYVYNHIYPPVNDFEEVGPWKARIGNWYEQNEGQALSDHPKELLKFYKEGDLALPIVIGHD